MSEQSHSCPLTDPKQIKFALLNFGYAEDAVMGNLVLYNAYGMFSSEQEAIQVLAEDLLAMYKLHTGYDDTERECCLINKKKKMTKDSTENNFCAECGKSLSADNKIYAGNFCDWLQGLLTMTLNDFGYVDHEAQVLGSAYPNPGSGTVGERCVVWEMGYSAFELIGLSTEEVLVLPEDADRQLCKVLGLDSHPDF